MLLTTAAPRKSYKLTLMIVEKRKDRESRIILFIYEKKECNLYFEVDCFMLWFFWGDNDSKHDRTNDGYQLAN
jgi:hypothetical protein